MRATSCREAGVLSGSFPGALPHRLVQIETHRVYFQCRQDMRTFGVFQSLVLAINLAAYGAAINSPRWNCDTGPGDEDHRALD